MRRKWKILTVAAIAVAALTGCCDTETHAEMNLRLGIECKQAGGEWKVIESNLKHKDQYCEFDNDK